MKVLIADDDFANRRLLEKLLISYGEVEAVEDGMSAVEKACSRLDQNEHYDLICLDIMMTKLDGYKALEAIREAESKFDYFKENRSKIVMISALDEVVVDNCTICNDYDAYICKPIFVDKFDVLMNKLGFSKIS